MLEGSLDDFGVEDVLWLVDRTRKSGELSIDRPAGRGRLFFRDGLLYCADSELLRESFEAQLVRTGLITPTQLRDAETRASAEMPIARTLLSLGFLHEEQLRSAFESRLVEATFELMRRDFGKFSWEADSKAEAEVDAPLGVQQIVESAATKAAHLAEIRTVIPSEASIPSLSRHPSRDLAAITITAEQWRLLALIDGASSIESIAHRAQLGDFTVLQMLHGLATRGLLEIAPADSETATRTAAAPADTGTAAATTLTKPFTIVLMCTANRIRSPLAEAFLRAHLGDLPAVVESVGIEGVEGQPAIPEAVEAARELGGDLSVHSARPLAAVDLSGADLVLGFESRHVRRAIRDGNAAPERTFTLPQFVKSLERSDAPAGDDLVSRARAAVELAHRKRAEDTPSAPRRSRDIEIVDPLGGPISAYRNTALRIRELCERASLGLFETTAT